MGSRRIVANNENAATLPKLAIEKSKLIRFVIENAHALYRFGLGQLGWSFRRLDSTIERAQVHDGRFLSTLWCLSLLHG